MYAHQDIILLNDLIRSRTKPIKRITFASVQRALRRVKYLLDSIQGSPELKRQARVSAKGANIHDCGKAFFITLLWFFLFLGEVFPPTSFFSFRWCRKSIYDGKKIVKSISVAKEKFVADGSSETLRRSCRRFSTVGGCTPCDEGADKASVYAQTLRKINVHR